MWDPNVEAVAFNALERYRQGSGENRTVTSAPGQVFRSDELLNSVACLVQPMLVGWDAFFIPRSAYGELEYFVLVSHGSFIDIETRTKDSYEKTMEVLKRFEWLRIDHGLSRENSSDNGLVSGRGETP